MNKITRTKWLIFSLTILIGISFSHCGKKSSGLLLLPNLVEGQGGPGVSPENPKTAQEETSTQQQAPSLQVVDDTGAVDTGSTNDNNSNPDNTPAVIEIPNKPIQQEPPQPVPADESTATNDNSNNASDGNSKPIQQEPPVVEPVPINEEIKEAINDEDVATDPQETVVVSDTESSQEISSQEQEEEIAAETEEDSEELAEVEESDSEEENKEEIPSPGKCKINVTEIDTSQGKWFNTQESLLPHPKDKNKTIKAKGIHTYWAYQKLLVKVKNNCEGGKYRLTIIAKNIGKLPEWYHYFNVKVLNEKTGENLGTILIRASDTRYHRGSLIVTLPKGESVLNLLWTNDAYEPDVYDANIQIKRIKIQTVQVKERKQILSRKGSRFCDVNGRWFIGTNPPSAYTYWANQTISYCLRTQKAGKYEIIVTAGNAKNGLPLMPEYKEFKVLVAANGNSNYISIPADQDKYHKGKTTLDLPEGDIVLNLTWLNDMYQPPKYDANIEIVRVQIKRVGDIESPIAAFLLQNPNITYKVVIPGIILILGALGLIYWIRREQIA